MPAAYLLVSVLCSDGSVGSGEQGPLGSHRGLMIAAQYSWFPPSPTVPSRESTDQTALADSPISSSLIFITAVRLRSGKGLEAGSELARPQRAWWIASASEPRCVRCGREPHDVADRHPRLPTREDDLRFRFVAWGRGLERPLGPEDERYDQQPLHRLAPEGHCMSMLNPDSVAPSGHRLLRRRLTEGNDRARKG